ncbi:Transcriptional regulatory protein KdpE [Candidatus Sulfotelmatomonas gaucii]|uniref:Transcriptional regulatory protein KdpE n=1 Tax=Candidatus Sulfuritelmatomonas gaucii TaxID=2043161 RepID=A0A2N9M760_9BACT|nr:Transcriptional regulatory protein KdpE [Candidatus Sulfotelmatomonas gaucii]
MPSPNGNILVTDDDPELRRVLRRTLDALGFEVAESANGEQALREVEAHPFNAVLLDVNMPGMGGIAACREIRRKAPRLQILMLSVRDQEMDKIEALDAGADDYITKPFSIPELAARLRSAVRRSTTAEPDLAIPIKIGDIELDPARRIVCKAGAALRLTPKEFDLLHYLMSRPGLPVAHVKLLRAVWGEDYGRELEYLRTFVHQLRKKLEDDPSSPEYLLTEPHFGYRFRAS